MRKSHAKTGHKHIYRRGTAYYYRFKDESGRWVERKYGASLDDAVAAQARAQSESDAIRNGLTTRAKIEARRHQSRPFTECLVEYIQHLTAIGNTAKYVRECHAQCRWLAKALRWNTLDDLQAGPLEKFLDRLRANGRGARCRNDYLGKAHAFAAFCTRRQYLPANPFHGITKLNQSADSRKPARALSPDEFARLLQAAPPARALAYWLAGGLGLRWTEIRKLDWDDVDLKTRQVRLPASSSKNRREAHLPLPESVARAIRAFSGHSGAICPHPPTRATFLADVKAAKIPPAKVMRRSLRKTFITHLALAGVDLRMAQRLARHSTPHLTSSIYTDASLLDLRGAVADLERVQCGTRVATRRRKAG